MKPRSCVSDWVGLLRPTHWLKNAIVFPALLLAGRGGEVLMLRQAFWVFAAFCLAASGVYALNDLIDRERDRLHPTKASRPVAAGRLETGAVLWAGLCLGLAAVFVAWWAPLPAAAVVLLYLGLNLAYSVALKHVPGVDATCVATGFVLRVIGVLGWPGACGEALLLGSVFGLCFYLTLAKRLVDQAHRLNPPTASPAGGREEGYSPRRLRWLMGLAALGTLVVYGTFAAVQPGSGWTRLATLIPVAYCLARLARQAHRAAGTEMLSLVCRDRRLLTATGVWLALWAASL